jgi:hypothetical protein
MSDDILRNLERAAKASGNPLDLEKYHATLCRYGRAQKVETPASHTTGYFVTGETLQSQNFQQGTVPFSMVIYHL